MKKNTPRPVRDWAIWQLADEVYRHQDKDWYEPVLHDINWLIDNSHGGIEVWRKIQDHYVRPSIFRS